jgi:peptide/nickel transport system substrate-binding protein
MDKMKPARILIALLLVLALVLPMAACGNNDDDMVYFRFGFGDQPDSLNPYYGTHTVTYYVFSSIYDTLFTRDADYNLANSLCTGYETQVNDDGTCTYTMTVRDDVKWHDGEKFTANDVAFTLYSTYYWSYAHSYDVLFLDPDSIEVVNDTTLKFTVESDYPYITEYLSVCPIYPEHVWKQYFTDDAGNWLATDDETAFAAREAELTTENMVGTGPFKWYAADDTACTLVRNDGYWNGKSGIGALVYVYNVSEPLTAVQNGELDTCMNMTASALDAIKSDPNFDYAHSMNYGFNCISFNLNAPDAGSSANQLIQIKEVRQAIDYCTPRDYILDMTYDGLGVAGDSLLSSNDSYYDNLRANYAGYRDSNAADSVERAIALLESAGFTYNASGAAYSDADKAAGAMRYNAAGEALSFRLYYDSNNMEDQDTCTIVQETCKKAGIELSVQGFDQATLWDYCDAYDYDMYIVEWGAYVDPSFSLSLFQWEDGYWAYAANGYNETGYANGEYDQLFNEQLYTKDDAQRRQLVNRMQEIVYEDCPMVILGYYYYLQPINSAKWQGYSQLPQGNEYGLMWDYTTMPYQLLHLQYIGG